MIRLENEGKNDTAVENKIKFLIYIFMYNFTKKAIDYIIFKK